MTNPNQNNDVDNANYRVGIYRLLAQVFRKELTTALVDRMNEHGLLAQFEKSGYQVESDKLKSDDFLRELGQEYTQVFIGPGPHVAPYGSVYHPDDAKKGQLWGDTTAWVRNFVGDHGLEFKGDAYDGIPDHVGHEFELFARLVEQEAVERQAGDTDKAERLLNSQRIFFNQQLNKWIPLFCAKIPSRASLPFYKEFARFTEDFIQQESKRLPENTESGS